MQSKPERRPQSFADVLAHRFFSESGKLRYLSSVDERWVDFEQRLATDLHMAVEKHDMDGLSRTVSSVATNSSGAHYNILRSGSPVSPLHRAARLGNADTIEAILREVHAEALPAVLDQRAQSGPSAGFTALHWAALHDHVDAARLLIERKCDTSLYNGQGKTSWDLATAARATDVEALFAELAAYTDEYPDLSREMAARKLRPAVADTFRDDLQLDHRRFVLWDIDVPFAIWVKLAEGGFGVVYLVSGVSPPIVIAGKHFSRIAMKVPKPSVRRAFICSLCSVLRAPTAVYSN
jgi:hypothetical protein